MAIDFGDNNTARYYSTPDHADFTLPALSTGWTIFYIARPVYVSAPGSSDHLYALSNDATFGATNSMQMWISATNRYHNFNVSGLTTTVNDAMPEQEWIIMWGRRTGGGVYAGYQGIDSRSKGREVYGGLIYGPYNSANPLIIGGRADLSATRFFRGQIETVGFTNNYSIPPEDFAQMAAGKPLDSFGWYNSLNFLMWGTSSATDRLYDTKTGKILTRAGSGYGVKEERAPINYTRPPARRLALYSQFVGGGATVQIGQSSESDTAFAFARLKSQNIGIAADTETALAMQTASSITIEQSIEIDAALSADGLKTRNIGVSGETDAALSVAALKTKTILQALETDTATTPATLKTRVIDAANEADTALNLVVSGGVIIGQSLESDAAIDVSHIKSRQIAAAGESYTTFLFVSHKTRGVDSAAELDTAAAMAVEKSSFIAQALESASALPFSADGSITVLIGFAAESDMAGANSAAKLRAIDRAAEADTPNDMQASYRAQILQAIENEEAFVFDAAVAREIGAAVEIDYAFALEGDHFTVVRAPDGAGYTTGQVIRRRPAAWYGRRPTWR